MGLPIVWLLLLLSLHSSASTIQNGSVPFIRTFAGHRILNGDLPDYLDLSVLEDDDGGSGFPPKPGRKPDHHHHHHAHNHFHVSKEAKHFLQGPLSTSLVPTIYLLVFVVSVPLNLVAVVMFLRHIRPRKPAVIYMLNLACADLLFGLLLPFKIAYHYHGNDWTYGWFMCRVVTAAFYCNMYCSVLLMACIGADRFLAVVYPMNALVWRTPRTAAAACACMWLLAIAGVCPLLTSGQTAHLPELRITTCHDVLDAHALKDHYRYFFPVYCTIFFFVPLACTVACYLRVIRALAAANVDNRSRKTRAVVMTVIVLVVFVACFAPTNVLLMVHYTQAASGSGDATYRAYLLSMCVGSLSCCLDPLLYYFGSSQCQRQVAALLGCRRPSRAGSTSSETQSTRTSGRSDSRRSCKMEEVQSDLASQYSRLVV